MGRCQREARVPSSAAAGSVGGEQGAVGGQVHAAGAQASALRTEALGALEKKYSAREVPAIHPHATLTPAPLASQARTALVLLPHTLAAAFAPPNLWLSFAEREVGTWKQHLQIQSSGLR